MSDKRGVHTDALATLGSIIGESEKRDAIHLAVEPTVAAEKLNPGQDVGVDGSRSNPVGIVDPFLKQPVLPGEKFWLIVYPRQITSLRHVWEHPAFAKAAESAVKSASEAWLRDFAGDCDRPNYDMIIATAISTPADSNRFCVYGESTYGEIPKEFWRHIENVTGKKFTNPAEYFSCTC